MASYGKKRLFKLFLAVLITYNTALDLNLSVCRELLINAIYSNARSPVSK